MENKAPLSGWRRIGVTGRGRAFLGWLCTGHQLDSRRPPTPLRGWGGGCRSQARERVPWAVWSAGQGEGVLRSRLCWGQGERTPPHFSAGRGKGGARNARPATRFLYVGPLGNFSIPGPRLGQGLPTTPTKEGPVPAKSGAQSGWGSVEAGGSEGDRNREGEAWWGRIPVQLRGPLCRVR